MTSNAISTLQSETEFELLHNILPFWMTKMIDHENGGFLGRVDGYGTVDHQTGKGCVLNARILWTFSSAYRIFKNNVYLETAERAREYLLQFFEDKKYGGFYWLLDNKGSRVDTKKQVYAQAFVIYALAEHYRATQSESSLKKAIELFHIIEKYSYDTKLGGYFEAFTREWGEISDLRLSEKDANEKKTMNTHLHILEAYTNLYRIWKDDQLKKQLQTLIELYADRFVNKKSFNLNMFFDENWNDKTDLISYGHNIESSWLLYEAAQVLGNRELIHRTGELSLKIAHASMDGLRPDGGLIYEQFFNGHTDTDRHWWVQAESVVGFFNAFELSENEDFLEKALASWKFISTHLIDKNKGEWFWSVNDNREPNRKEDKAGFWKCPYHNSRMCFELLERKSGK